VVEVIAAKTMERDVFAMFHPLSELLINIPVGRIYRDIAVLNPTRAQSLAHPVSFQESVAFFEVGEAEEREDIGKALQHLVIAKKIPLKPLQGDSARMKVEV
jgi:hypothetical protein